MTQFLEHSLYAQGEGVAQDFAAALKYFKLAAKQGHMDAQYEVGHMYHAGKGVAQNLSKAFKCWKKAADQGHRDAQFNVGVMYNQGEVVTQDLSEIFKYWKKAADQGHREAQLCLAGMYKQGKGCTQDSSQALIYLKKAALQGVTEAWTELGKFVATGFGPYKPNLHAAMHFFLKGAELDEPFAMIDLALAILEMKQGEDYLDQALFWIQRVQKSPDEKITSYFKELIEKILRSIEAQKAPSPEEVAQEEQALATMMDTMEQPQRPTILAPSMTSSDAARASSAEEVWDEDEFSLEGELTLQEPDTAASADDIPTAGPTLEPINNPKRLREMLRTLAPHKKSRATQPQEASTQLSDNNQRFIAQIKQSQEQYDEVSYETLHPFFQDPFFKRQVVMHQTKSGFMVAAHNLATGQYATANTHRMHAQKARHLPKQFQHADPGFVADLRKLLEDVFGL